VNFEGKKERTAGGGRGEREKVTFLIAGERGRVLYFSKAPDRLAGREKDNFRLEL